MKTSVDAVSVLHGLLLGALVCCTTHGVGAQTRVEISAHGDWTRVLVEELDVMADEDGSWTATNLFVAPDSLFGPNTTKTRPSLSNYWARFVLVNPTEREQWIIFESYYWDYVRLYFRDSTGHVSRLNLGILGHPHINTFLARPNAEYAVLANFESSGRFRREDRINLVIKPSLSALAGKSFTHYLDGITFGIMFGLALYNLFLYLSLRDRTYLWYTVYIFSFALSFMTLFASAPSKWTQYFSPGYPQLAFYIKKIADPVIWIAYTNFVRNFLVTRIRHPVWDRVLKACIGLIGIQFMLNLTGAFHFTGVARITTWNLPVIVGFILAISSYVKGYSRARFFILGQFFLLGGITITSLHYAGADALAWLPDTALVNYFRTPSATFAFGAVESIVFSLALADKYNRLQQDITRVEIEKEKEKSEALRLQELDTFKSRFYSNITHEFRTPLTVIEGMAAELEKHPEKETRKRLNLIRKNSQDLLTLVNQMLDLSKLQAGKMESDVRQSDVVLFLRSLVEMHESFARMHQLSLQFYAEVPVLSMDFDAGKLERVLTNLLSNAIKFTPAYGKVTVAIKQITRDEGAVLRLTVRDTGIGIAAEELVHVFDRFHRVNAGYGQVGTGIGLALVQDLVHTMGGSIRVESVVDKGSSFTVDLPITDVAPVGPESAHHTYTPPPAYGTAQLADDGEAGVDPHDLPILLIIEDNADVAYYLQSCLEEQYQILVCRNGKNGVDRALELLPDIIICDVMMPELDGFEVCSILKNNDRTSHIPIILLTAKANSEDKVAGLARGADAYLVKPFNKEELTIRLEKLLEVRRTLQRKYSSTLISNQSVVSTENREDTYIQKVERIVLDHLEDEDFSVYDLARELHLSRSQVHRKLKALTGMSTAIYVRHIRLQQARILLGSTELSIAEIAFRVGFRTPVYFSQVFKETFGESPSATRK
ncbi:7TM diverse intracellular signaling domain-containing protein [Lewinella sp. JB7]|uniref:7TM diverse intracellular signaling domain-containing protein n=1 Tax=Lewinella sp. JB7 TaxID=2962887 RepID=UPI0020C9F163|nr:7TM diverse intracellular signaling domain-containing protein [Lewinella sp. JB7]MCP9234854.1 response regulator [Lewinella sp. JB7]